MKAPKALTFCSLLFAVVFPLPARFAPQAAPKSVEEAKQSLEKAQRQLRQAMARIAKNPPPEADIERAHQAVRLLKVAIDEGAPFEPRDLNYAKAALAARKQLRTDRPAVDKRRAEIHIHNSHREMDRALARLARAVKHLDAKNVTEAAFESAHKKIRLLKEVIARAEPLADGHPEHKARISIAQSELKRQEAAVASRQTEVAVQKQRLLVNESRENLKRALGAISKSQVPDENFKAAETAADGLAQRLAQAKELELKDAAYRTYALEITKEVADAKKQIDRRWSEAGLAKLKAEFEPSRLDLTQAARVIRDKNPSEERLAEAKTASIVVQKLLEKFSHLRARSQAVRTYFSQIEATLVEVQVNLQRRQVVQKQALVASALKALAGPQGSPSAFQKAEEALKNARTTLKQGDHLTKQNRAYATYVKKITQAQKRAQEQLDRHQAEQTAHTQQKTVESRLERMNQALSALMRKGASLAVADAALQAAEQVQAALDGQSALEKANARYRVWANISRRSLARQKKQIEKRRLDIVVQKQESAIEDRFQKAIQALRAADRPGATQEEVKKASTHVEAIYQVFENGSKVEKKHWGYRKIVRSARKRLRPLEAQLRFLQLRLSFQQGPATALVKGTSTAQGASESGNLALKKNEYDKAIGLFESCLETGKVIASRSKLWSTPFMIEGQPVLAKKIMALCDERLQTTQKQQTRVEGMLAFYSGPAQLFEDGIDALTKAQRASGSKQKDLKKGALSFFENCISSGKILGFKHPELKKLNFDVARQKITLFDLIARCKANAKRLRQGQ